MLTQGQPELIKVVKNIHVDFKEIGSDQSGKTPLGAGHERSPSNIDVIINSVLTSPVDKRNTKIEILNSC